MCAPIFELPSNINTMAKPVFSNQSAQEKVSRLITPTGFYSYSLTQENGCHWEPEVVENVGVVVEEVAEHDQYEDDDDGQQYCTVVHQN